MHRNDLSLPFLGERLSHHIKSLNISQREAGRRCGLSPKIINEYTSGRRIPSINALYQICTNLGISADYLLGLNSDNAESFKQAKLDLLYQIVDIIEEQLKEDL